MRASKGGLTEERIMSLTWRQFGVYLDSFTWSVREEVDEGKRKNRGDDLLAMLEVPELRERKKKMLEEVHNRLKKIKDRENERIKSGKKATGTKRVIGE